jgi:hypothetical protein
LMGEADGVLAALEMRLWRRPGGDVVLGAWCVH